MLRQLAYGYRDYAEMPDSMSVRYNWMFFVVFEGHIHPEFDPPLPNFDHRTKANFYIIPPQTSYRAVTRQPRCERAVFHFAYVSDILQKEIQPRGAFAKWLSPKDLQEVRRLVEKVKNYYQKPTALSELYFELCLVQLELLALRDIPFQSIEPLWKAARERVAKATAWYLEHMDQSPTLSDIAASVHISPSQLRRDFTGETKKNPKAIFNRLRMEKATRLLATTSLILDQIAERCGFQTATEFCRAFKKVFGVTPNHWRHHVNASGVTDPSLAFADTPALASTEKSRGSRPVAS